MTRYTTQFATLAVAALATTLAACGKAPNTAEFVQACVKTQATQKMCECAAKEAASKLSPDLFNAMVYDMQGKRQELAVISDKMSFDERASFAQKQFEIMGACMKDG
jgi:predicted lipase